jgi:hypothetical protein
MRFRKPVSTLKKAGAAVRIVTGIDLDGTSANALEEILSWKVDARVVKNRRPGHTFHPKIYLFERKTRADVLIGSSNWTEGGFYNNYESSVHVMYDRPDDEEDYRGALKSLEPFLEPGGPATKPLTRELLDLLVRKKIVQSERDIQKNRRRAEASVAKQFRRGQSPFGEDTIADPPSMDADLLAELVRIFQKTRKRRIRRLPADRRLVLKSALEITPIAFYMHLPKLQGTAVARKKPIPGEARIPLEARDLAEEFWGWPDKYVRQSHKREYWSWKPKWRIADAAAPDRAVEENVRMYFYPASSDFRFYSPYLVSLGADRGDVVRIIRLEEEDAEFECLFAKAGTTAHTQWAAYCTQRIRNSPGRWFGYA